MVKFLVIKGILMLFYGIIENMAYGKIKAHLSINFKM